MEELILGSPDGTVFLDVLGSPETHVFLSADPIFEVGKPFPSIVCIPG